jgi:hypothetical protein
MSAHTAGEHPQGVVPLWVRIGGPCMFLALTLIRILDNGFARLGWVTDLCVAIVFLIFVPRLPKESLGTYFKRPRTLVVVLLFGIALTFGVLFDARHFFAN